jgi:hypothetical protein
LYLAKIQQYNNFTLQLIHFYKSKTIPGYAKRLGNTHLQPFSLYLPLVGHVLSSIQFKPSLHRELRQAESPVRPLDMPALRIRQWEASI